MGVTLQNVVAGLGFRIYRIRHEQGKSHVADDGNRDGSGSGGSDRAGGVVLSQGTQERTKGQELAQASGTRQRGVSGAVADGDGGWTAVQEFAD